MHGHSRQQPKLPLIGKRIRLPESRGVCPYAVLSGPVQLHCTDAAQPRYCLLRVQASKGDVSVRRLLRLPPSRALQLLDSLAGMSFQGVYMSLAAAYHSCE